MMNPEEMVPLKYKKGERLIFQESEKRIPVIFQRCLLEGKKLKYEVKDKDGKMTKTFKQHLSRPEDPNIGLIPITPANYKKALEDLPPQKL